MKNILNNYVRFLTSTKLLFFTILWLIILLIVVTIEQKNLGLYLAHKKYFSYFFIWIYFIPLPSGYTTLSILFINLSFKVFLDKWSFNKLGTIIIHIGCLILLLGGFITFIFSYEGSMTIDEGHSSNYISDYSKNELVVINLSDKKYNTTTAFAEKLLKKGNILESSSIPFSLQIKKYYKNCYFSLKKRIPNQIKENKSMLDIFEIGKEELDKDDELNNACIFFKILDKKDKYSEYDYAISKIISIKKIFNIDNKKYLITLKKAKTYLPFSINLISFQKEVYPATNTAKSYESKIIVKDKGFEWPSVIKMNHPLRYHGYTFYQSSFINSENKATTVLAVVKNIGYVFPYISGIIISFGLLIHIIQRMRKFKK